MFWRLTSSVEVVFDKSLREQYAISNNISNCFPIGMVVCNLICCTCQRQRLMGWSKQDVHSLNIQKWEYQLKLLKYWCLIMDWLNKQFHGSGEFTYEIGNHNLSRPPPFSLVVKYLNRWWRWWWFVVEIIGEYLNWCLTLLSQLVSILPARVGDLVLIGSLVKAKSCWLQIIVYFEKNMKSIY